MNKTTVIKKGIMTGTDLCRILLLTAVLFVITAGAACAADYDGYIFKLSDSAAVLLSDDSALMSDTEEVYEPANLYKTDDEAVISKLQNAGLLEYAEPDYIVTLSSVPDDTFLTDGTQWSMSAIEMEPVWKKGLTGEGVRIAIIDSGLYAEHEEFAGTAIVQGINYCADEGSSERSDTSDETGHGTFAAGIISAAANNGTGTAGIAPGAEIVPLKCFDSKTASVSLIIKAIYDAVDEYDCDIINMSWGLTTDTKSLKTAVDYAASKGIIMTAAAGNLASGKTSTGNDPLEYPAAYDNVIAVGAVGSDKSIASFSYINSSLFVVAPGKDLKGLDIKDESSYRTGSGTSYATPAVSAVAALALSIDPDMTMDELESLIMETSLDLGDEGYDTTYGYGLLQAGSLISALQEDMETVTAEASDGTVTISAGKWGFDADEKVNAVAAVYSSTGQMLGCTAVQTVADKYGFVKLNDVQVQEAAAAGSDTAAAGQTVKIFFAGSAWQPLCGAIAKALE